MIFSADRVFHTMMLQELNRAGLGMFAAGSESAFCQGSQHEQTCSGSRRSCTLVVSAIASRRYTEPNPTVCGTESKVGGYSQPTHAGDSECRADVERSPIATSDESRLVATADNSNITLALTAQPCRTLTYAAYTRSEFPSTNIQSELVVGESNRV